MGLTSIENEHKLLHCIAGGDDTAFRTLYNGYVHQASNTVFALTHSKELTEEIIQDVFLKVWKERTKLTGIQKFNAYLFISLRNCTINYLASLVAERKKYNNYASHLLSQPQAEPETTYQVADKLDQLISELPRQQRIVFLLRAQGFKNPEIARRMKLSTASVKKYNQLALKFLQKKVNAEKSLLACLALIHLFK
ncbi:hypothetical protein COR50_20040 [Chitinophaga caeni]|uniref:RNA polymerase sigma-70 factor n=1 Tax=Chitinophaga caeni TaxID=2029983 RepID=A0A291QZA5_9BACT|nr:sigma-70 family RNA polymerase sigma factor [Chitinophaga caeni]ATL49278.1 hypothetical protein COR50_20040 [Chitinophaga caeni]